MLTKVSEPTAAPHWEQHVVQFEPTLFALPMIDHAAVTVTEADEKSTQCLPLQLLVTHADGVTLSDRASELIESQALDVVPVNCQVSPHTPPSSCDCVSISTVTVFVPPASVIQHLT